MKDYRLVQLYSISFVFLLINSVLAQPKSRSLCEQRCFHSNLQLSALVNFWHRMTKRIGRDKRSERDEDLSFETFVKSLVLAANSRPKLNPLKMGLLKAIEKYEKCVKACEHQHSKRTSERTSDSYIRPSLCLAKDFCL